MNVVIKCNVHMSWQHKGVSHGISRGIDRQSSIYNGQDITPKLQDLQLLPGPL